MRVGARQNEQAGTGLVHRAAAAEAAMGNNDVVLGIDGAALVLDCEAGVHAGVHAKHQCTTDKVRVYRTVGQFPGGIIGGRHIDIRNASATAQRIIDIGRPRGNTVKSDRREDEISANAKVLPITIGDDRDFIEEVGVIDRTDKVFLGSDGRRNATKQQRVGAAKA